MNHSADSTETWEAETTVSRRDALRSGAEQGSKVLTKLGFAAIPIALAAMARDAAAQTATDVLDALQFLLRVEYMQAELTLRALSVSGFVPTADFDAFRTMHTHDASHVTVISSAITSVSGTPDAAPSFDWTAKGNFPGFSFAAGQYETFKIIAQGLKDVGVRAYKGQAARMTINHPVVTTVLSIHTVEARHSTEVRLIRAKKPWITGNSRDDLPAFFQPVYDGEEITVHNGIDSATVTGGSTTAATEAFDEPLTKDQANAIISPFIA